MTETGLECYFVMRVMQALELLTAGPVTAPGIHRLLGIHTRTARRLLDRLLVDGWVERIPAPGRGWAYVPTPQLRALGEALAPAAASDEPIADEDDDGEDELVIALWA